MSELKQNLREPLLNQRRNLDIKTQQQAASAATKLLLESKLLDDKKHIAFYLPFSGELNTHQLIEWADKNNKQCYLPHIASNIDRTMLYYEFKPGDPTVKNSYQVHEPIPDIGKQVPISILDAVVVPLVAFDESLHRLGMGAGYYDRSFSFADDIRAENRATLIGFAYEFQKIDQVPQDAWDIPLDYVVTEKRIFTSEESLSTP